MTYQTMNLFFRDLTPKKKESIHQSHEIMVHFESAVPPNLQS